MIHEEQVECPYCGETFTMLVDLSQGNHRTVEDCYVCCQPIEYLIDVSEGVLRRVDVFTGNDPVY